MPTKSLQATIFGVDNATPTFEKVGRSATGLADDMERSGDRMGKAFSKGAQMAAGALAAIGFADFVKGTITEASNLEQNVGGVEAVFKGTAETIKQFGDTSGQVVGLARQDYFELATMFGSQLKNMGVAADELAPKTNELIQLGADLSAMYGGTAAEAVEAISSLLRGERDPIERYGVSIKQASITAYELAHGLDTSTTAAKTASDTQASLALLFDQTRDAQGRFGVEADTTAGQQQRLAAAFKEAQAEIGEKLLPVLNDLMQFAAHDLVPVLSAVADGLGLVIDVVNAVPGPVKAALVAMAGWKMFQQTAVFEKLAGGARGFRVEMEMQKGLAAAQGVELSTMGAAAATAQVRIGGLASAVGKGGALAAGIWVVSSIASAFGKLAENSERAEAATHSISDALVASGGVWDETARKQREAQIEGADSFDALIKAGISYSDIMTGMTGSADDFARLMQQVGSADSGVLFHSFDELTKLHNAVTSGSEALAQQKIAYEQSSAAAADAAGKTAAAAAADRDAAIAAGTYRDAQDAARTAVAERASASALASAAASQLGQWQDAERSGASALAAEWDKTTVAVKSFAQAALEAAGVDVAFTQAVSDVYASAQQLADGMRDAEEASRKSGDALFTAAGDFDLSTAAGRDLADAMGQYRDDALAAVNATYQHVAATGDLEGAVAAAQAAADQQRAGFVQMATTILGYSVPAAEAIADKLGFIQGIQINDKTFTIGAIDNATPVIARVLSLMEQLKDPRMARESASEWAALSSSAFNKIALGVTPTVTSSGGGARSGGGGGSSAASKAKKAAADAKRAQEQAQREAERRAEEAARKEQQRQEAMARTVEGTFGQIGRSVQKPFDVAEFGIKGVESQLARSQRSLENAISKGLDPKKADALRKELEGLGKEAQRQLGSLRLKIVTSDLDNFAASLDDSVDAMHSQVAQLEKDLRAAGASSSMIARLGSLESQLTDAMTRRTDVTKRLETAQSALNAVMDQYKQRVDAVRDSFVAFGSVTNMEAADRWGNSLTMDAIIAQMEDRAKVADKFTKDVEALRRSGLNETTLQQIISAGPGTAAAQASVLASATDAELQKINSLTAQVFGDGTRTGSLSAEWMYRSGINAAQAVVDGLIAEQQELQDTIANLSGGVEILVASEMKKQGVAAADGVIAGLNARKPALIKTMETLGTEMTKAFKKTLDIHSPSRVMANEVGVPVVDGIIAGMKSRGHALVAAAADMRGSLMGSNNGFAVSRIADQTSGKFTVEIITKGEGALTGAIADTSEIVVRDALGRAQDVSIQRQRAGVRSPVGIGI